MLQVKKRGFKVSRASYLKNKLKRKKAKKKGLIQHERKPKRTVKIKKAMSDRPDKGFLRFCMENNQLAFDRESLRVRY